MKYLFLFLSRSGGHAVINWVCSQLDRGAVFYNNCAGYDKGQLYPIRRGTKKYLGKDRELYHKIYGIEKHGFSAQHQTGTLGWNNCNYIQVTYIKGAALFAIAKSLEYPDNVVASLQISVLMDTMMVVYAGFRLISQLVPEH